MYACDSVTPQVNIFEPCLGSVKDTVERSRIRKEAAPVFRLFVRAVVHAHNSPLGVVLETARAFFARRQSILRLAFPLSPRLLRGGLLGWFGARFFFFLDEGIHVAQPQRLRVQKRFDLGVRFRSVAANFAVRRLLHLILEPFHEKVVWGHDGARWRLRGHFVSHSMVSSCELPRDTNRENTVSVLCVRQRPMKHFPGKFPGKKR